MSELEKREVLSRYDSMPTEELQEILRKHTHGELETEPDTQDLFEIMEVLSKRRQEENPQAFRSNEEAFAEFKQYYMPKEKNVSVQPKKFHFPTRLLRTVAAVLAVVVILTVGMTVTANAFRFDLWGKIASWTKEIFHFSDVSGPDVTAPEKDYPVEYDQLRKILEDYGIEEKIVPSWLPDGYKHKDVTVKASPKVRSIYAIYEKNYVELVISIRQTIGVPAHQVEKNEDLLEIYTADNVEYYIFSNTETLQVAWSIGEYECKIVGKISIEEMKVMIDSI
jgi:hypothetical protein